MVFDNYDCFFEISTGKDILHDTVGITYQIVKLYDTIDDNPLTDQETTETNPSTADFNIVSTSSSGRIGIHLSISDQIIHSFNGKYSMDK